MSAKPAEAIKDRLALTGALLLGAIIRFGFISKSSIWHDEGYTMMLAPQSPGQILARTGRDVHPPLYYLTLHYWMQLFGGSEAAARGLSTVAMLLAIVVTFSLVKRLFGSPAARLSAFFLAVGPFLVRYSQEARMYGLVAFFLALATWLLVRALESNKYRDWVFYSLAIAAALYTHYYSIFMIVVHWVYVTMVTLWPKGKPVRGKGLLNPRWWAANVLAAGLFAPWLPVAYSQFTRVQASFWIPPVTPATIPSTIAQFLTFTDMGAFPLTLRLLAFTAFLAVIAAALWGGRKKLPEWTLMTAYMGLGPLAVFLLSYKRPIYVDRYFVFAAVAFYAYLAVLLYHAWPWRGRAKLRALSVVLLLLVFGIGIRDVYSQSNHKMRQLAEIVNDKFVPGDVVISGELYTYFDFSYYNHTGQNPVKLLAPDGVNGYGESSLLYDRAGQIVVHDYSELRPASGHVWVIGKTGQHDYFDKVPANWHMDFRAEDGYVATQRYRVTSQP